MPPVPAISIAPGSHQPPVESPLSSSSEISLVDHSTASGPGDQRRPRRARRSSGSMIIDARLGSCEMRDDEEEYDQGDVRCMSPKRSVEDVERLGEEARQHLIDQAAKLQANLMAIVDRVETIKEEHDKLEGGNKFLQQYIGELIQTTQMASCSKSKAKNSSRK